MAKFKDILKQEPLPVALKEEKIEISMISGSSAGALVAAIVGSGISTPDALKLLTEIPVKDVWDPGIGLGYLKWSKVESILATHLRPKLEDLSIKVAVSAFEIQTLKTKVFTEGATAPIVRASCTPPFLVHPAKINGKRYLDGGIFDKSGILGIPKDRPCLSHFLMSHLPDRKWDFSHNLKKRRDNQLMISFPDLIEIKPSNLQMGYQAFDKCFENTMKILNTDIEELRSNHFKIPNLFCDSRKL